MTTTTMPIADGGLAMMTLKHNLAMYNGCKTGKRSTRQEGLDGVNAMAPKQVQKRSPRFYRDLKAWSDLTDSEMPEPTTLQEVYNELLFLDIKADITEVSSIQESLHLLWQENTSLQLKICDKTMRGFISSEEFLDADIRRRV